MNEDDAHDYRTAGSRRRRIPVLAAAVFAAAAATACTRPAEPLDASSNRVVLFALDAGTWEVLDPLIDRGLLPNLAKLKEAGTSGNLMSISPSSSPVIWTSVATGKSPEKHGITSFVRFPDGNPGQPAPVNRMMRQGKALWNILSASGREVAIVGWFVTWPPEEVRGVMISDHAHYGDSIEAIFPPGYLGMVKTTPQSEVDQALPLFMDYDFDPAKLDPESDDPDERLNFLVHDRFVRAYKRDLYYMRATGQLLSERLPDFLAVYLRGTDDVQHGFWKFMDPEGFDGVSEAQRESFGRVIEEYWHWTDTAVGKLLEYYEDDDPLVLVVSDHGAGPALGEFEIIAPEYLHLSGAHRDEGILIAKGPGVRQGATVEGAGIYDITPTILRYLGEPVGRDMDGNVLDGLFTDAITARPVEYVETHDDPDGGDNPPPLVAPSSKNDAAILEHLKSLGYIE